MSAYSAALAAAGVTASSSTNVVTLVASSPNVISYTASVSGPTELATIGQSLAAAGTISPSRSFTANPILAGAATSTSNSVNVTGVSGGGTPGTSAFNITINGAPSQALTYDPNGNLTSDGTNIYAWDAENRLLKITNPASGTYSQFSYDAEGRAVRIQEFSGGSSASDLGFVWCGCAEGIIEKREFEPRI